MDYGNVLKSFVERTRINLNHIEKSQKEGVDVYETTQLINSCLGLLVLPQQKFLKKIPAKYIAELEREGWPIPRVSDKYKKVTTLYQLVTKIRNAITHFNIRFIVDHKNEISAIRIWNKNHKGRKNWEGFFTVNDLKKFVEMFSNLLLSYYSSRFFC